MWERRQLKRRAKEYFLKNYFATIGAVLLFTVISLMVNRLTIELPEKLEDQTIVNAVAEDTGINADQIKGIIDGSNVYNLYNECVDEMTKAIDDDEMYKITSEYEEKLEKIFDQMITIIKDSRYIALKIIFGLLITALFLAGTIFISNAFELGNCKWFLNNRSGKANMDDLLVGIKANYSNTFKIMGARTIFTLLWSLLFIVPGIIKSYEYRMIPYLLAENPNMDMKEAFKVSKMLMKGDKWNAFVLDLSFILWNLLAMIFMTIPGILFVYPYIYATNAELYVELCNRKSPYKAKEILE